MKNRLVAMAFSACGAVAFAGAIYTEAPEDGSSLVVEDATTSMACLPAVRDHLKQYWTFDAADNLYSNSVGTLSLSAMEDATTEHRTGDDAKLGGGAVYTKKGFRASENIIDGRRPFTIMFWIKKPSWSQNQETLVYIGQKPETDGAQIQTERRFLRLSYGNRESGVSGKLYLWDNQVGNASGGTVEALATVGTWNHIALTCSTMEKSGAVTSNNYTIVVNGVEYKSAKFPQNAFESSDYFLLGYGWHYQGGNRAISDALFDEIMIFDRALSKAEIAAIKEQSQPFEFSADWAMVPGGFFDLYGLLPQRVGGYGGTVSTVEGLVLTPTRNTTYAGAVSGAAFALDAASSSVTQTLAGANSYTGATHVKSGVLAINPKAAFPALETPVVAYWPCDAFSTNGVIVDMSGNGNHLYPDAGVGDATIDAGSCIADGALYIPRTVSDSTGFTSASRMKGFISGDNSFTVACWVRIDAVSYREGIFSFGSSNGVRFNGSTDSTISQKLYFGDRYNSKIITDYSMPTSEGSFGDGKWRHLAVAYDKTKANGTDACYFLYTNGCLAVSSPLFDSVSHAVDSFHLGVGVFVGMQGSMKGALDDVVVLNGASAEDVATLYNWRRGAYEAENLAKVLPEKTRITVDADATLFLTNANEKARSLSGAGTVHIAVGSTLEVRSCSDFTGAVVGGGALICPGMAIVIR